MRIAGNCLPKPLMMKITNIYVSLNTKRQWVKLEWIYTSLSGQLIYSERLSSPKKSNSTSTFLASGLRKLFWRFVWFSLDVSSHPAYFIWLVWIYDASEHIEAETKWPPFSRQHFQTDFLENAWTSIKFHWSLFLGVQLTTFQHCLK